jgi:RNA polymerase sigma-70 factor (ECF subfamily)
MVLQQSATTPTNVPPILSSAGDSERLTRIAQSHGNSLRLGQSANLQPVGPGLVDAKRTEQSLSELEFPTLESGNDYALASDDQLLAAAKSSDGRAFEELSGRYLQSIRKRVHLILRNPEDTEDVVQDSLLKAFRHLKEFRESCGFSGWITRIAINTALMLLRKRRSRPEVSLYQAGETDETWSIWDFPEPSPSAERTYARQETLSFMSRAVNRLSPTYRNVLELYHAQEYSLREAADKLGITVASAKSRLFRARRSLRSMLEGQQISIFDARY